MARKRIEFRHLQAFVEVCEHRHFTRASQSLAISQPALSALISQLEQDLGTQLLVRTTRSVEVTPAGREFLQSAARIVADLLRSVQEVQDYSELRRGRLRVAALPSLCAFILPQVAKTFCARHGGVDLSIIDAMGDEVVEQVTRRQVDFGIGYVTSTDLVIAEPFLTDRLVAVGLPERLGGKRSLRWKDLANVELIAMSQGTTIRRLVEQGCREAGVTPRIVLEASQMQTALAYAREGLGIAVLPSSGVPGQTDNLGLAELTSPTIERSLSVITARSNPISPPAAAFLRILEEQCGQGAKEGIGPVP